jgi:hypothetical protein
MVRRRAPPQPPYRSAARAPSQINCARRRVGCAPRARSLAFAFVAAAAHHKNRTPKTPKKTNKTQAPGEDCAQRALTYAAALGLVGVLPGFFRAHNALRRLPLSEMMRRWANVKRTARIVADPVATFAASGAAYGAAECATEAHLGREDTAAGLAGGAAVGAVLGLKAGSIASGFGYAGLFAGLSLVSDFYAQIAHPAFDSISLSGDAAPAGGKAATAK